MRQPPRNKLIGKLDERLPNLAKVDVDDAHLRANADNAQLKGADMVARAAIEANLFVKVTNRSEENLFGDELGSTPAHLQTPAVGKKSPLSDQMTWYRWSSEV